MNLRFLHLADAHLGAKCSFLGSISDERSREIVDTFIRAVEYAGNPENRIHGVVISGDLFEVIQPEPSIVSEVINAFSSLNKSGIPVILTPGTHDSWEHPQSVYRKTEFPGVELLTDPQFGEPVIKNIHGVQVFFYGMSYSPGKSEIPGRKKYRKTPDGIHIAVLHGSLIDHSGLQIDLKDLPLYRDDLQQWGMDYIALGHYHNFQEYKAGETKIVYPGTIEGKKFNETGERYLVIVEFSNSTAEVHKIPFNRRTLFNVEIDLSMEGIGSLEDLQRAVLRYADENTLLRLALKGNEEFYFNVDKLCDRLKENFYYLEIIDQTRIVDSSLIVQYQNEKTVRGLFIRKMQKKIAEAPPEQKEVYQNALKIGMDGFLHSSEP